MACPASQTTPSRSNTQSMAPDPTGTPGIGAAAPAGARSRSATQWVVPRFEPFPGLRYAPSHVKSLDDVVCPPYDVISDSDRAALEARSPSNVVRLELPHDDGGGNRYERARELLDSWRDGGVLHRDGRPAFYGYRMSYSDPSGRPARPVGVIGALGLEPPGEGLPPHGEPTPKAKPARPEPP